MIFYVAKKKNPVAFVTFFEVQLYLPSLSKSPMLLLYLLDNGKLSVAITE